MNREIYQDIILSHFRAPKWKESLGEDTDAFTVRNPSCGDVIRLRVAADDIGTLHVIHDAQGCAASVSSCSIMCDTLQGLSIDEASRKVEIFLEALNRNDPIQPNQVSLEIEALLFFRNVPARRQCVSLAWTCAQNALAALRKAR